MAKRSFLTLGIDLQVHADRFADEYLGPHGYRVRVEPQGLGFPLTPTFLAHRQQTSLIVLVDTRVRPAQLEAWSRYARSCTTDTQVAVCVPESGEPPARIHAKLQHLRIGLFVIGPAITQRIAPVDLGINIQAPDLATLRPKTRRRLAPAIEKVERGDWRDGLKDACEVLEVEARRHLREGLATPTPRIALKDPSGKSYNLPLARIRRLTMGQLADVYRRIQPPNRADDLALQVMDKLKKDRNDLTHHSRKPSTERRLRRNAGSHIWSIANAVQALMGERP